jgi:hypothetical protein
MIFKLGESILLLQNLWQENWTFKVSESISLLKKAKKIGKNRG